MLFSIQFFGFSTLHNKNVAKSGYWFVMGYLLIPGSLLIRLPYDQKHYLLFFQVTFSIPRDNCCRCFFSVRDFFRKLFFNIFFPAIIDVFILTSVKIFLASRVFFSYGLTQPISPPHSIFFIFGTSPATHCPPKYDFKSGNPETQFELTREVGTLK